jgi:hypothetical protein
MCLRASIPVQVDTHACGKLLLYKIMRGNLSAVCAEPPRTKADTEAVMPAFLSYGSNQAEYPDPGAVASIALLKGLQTPLLATLESMLVIDPASSVRTMPSLHDAVACLRQAARELGEQCGLEDKVRACVRVQRALHRLIISNAHAAEFMHCCDGLCTQCLVAVCN